jgi:hypothetical protein
MMKVIICMNGGEAIPVMNIGEETMAQFSEEQAKEWCDTSILGRSSQNHIIDIESGEMELY